MFLFCSHKGREAAAEARLAHIYKQIAQRTVERGLVAKGLRHELAGAAGAGRPTLPETVRPRVY